MARIEPRIIFVTLTLTAFTATGIAIYAMHTPTLILLFGLTSSCLLAYIAGTRIANRKINKLTNLTGGLKSAHEMLQQNIALATSDLRQSLETIEIQNIELEISKKEAENASNVKSEFLASMSHELRTPLNGIIGFVNLLFKTSINANQHDYLLTIQKSATTLLSIINDILDFSKMEAGKLQLDLEPTDIRECLEDALTLLAPSAHEKLIELIPYFSSDVPELVLADQLRIKQVLTNLVNNSIKFTEMGCVIVRVMVDQELPNNKVILCISVEDTGKGLTLAQQKELFNAFDQLDPKITKKFGGTGLGLVICKRLIEQMQGEIHLESTPNKGTTFWFTMTTEKINNPNYASLKSPELQDKKILLFEQHPVTNLALIHTLKNFGIHVENASTFEDIILQLEQAYALNSPFHLVLLGMNQLDKEDKMLTTVINEAQNNYQCSTGILINTTEHILHNKTLLSGVKLCLAKPICRAKLQSALSNFFLNYSSANNPDFKEKKLHILTVDDNSANTKLLSTLLKNIGVTVTTAANGEEALQYINNQTFNLIFMDINMPGLDGLETAKAIRQANTPNKHTPIIALSAQIVLNRKTTAMQEYINSYLNKPINENELKATIYKWTHENPMKNKANNPQQPTTANSAITNSLSNQENQELQSIDWQLAKKLAADNMELAKDLFFMLLNDLPETKKHINAAFAANNLQELRNHVHKLHGGCCYVGVPKLKHLAKSLEIAIINLDTEQIKSLLLELNDEITVVLSTDVNEIKLKS